jgi:hypothetical protein
MGLLDGLLGQIGANVDVENMARKVGISPEQAEQAVTALGEAHFDPADTATVASEKTGLSVETLQEIIGHIGGEGSLASFAQLMKEDGSIGSKLSGLASGLFGKG